MANIISIGLRSGLEEQMGAGIADGVARRLALVAAEIVEDDDIAGIEGWCQALLDPGGEGNAVERAIEHEGRDDAVVAQSRRGRPASSNEGVDAPLPSLMCQSGGVENHSRKTSMTEVGTIGLAAALYVLGTIVVMGFVPRQELVKSVAPFSEAARRTRGRTRDCVC